MTGCHYSHWETCKPPPRPTLHVEMLENTMQYIQKSMAGLIACIHFAICAMSRSFKISNWHIRSKLFPAVHVCFFVFFFVLCSRKQRQHQRFISESAKGNAVPTRSVRKETSFPEVSKHTVKTGWSLTTGPQSSLVQLTFTGKGHIWLALLLLKLPSPLPVVFVYIVSVFIFFNSST